MIILGLSDTDKHAAIKRYVKEHDIKKVFILSPSDYFFNCDDAEFIEYADIIMYVTYYRLLQEIDHSTLVVVNECLQTKNRNDLTYNCIRNFLNQTDHVLVLNYLPIIESSEDFFILFDFDTHSKWKRETNFALMCESDIEVNDVNIKLNKIDIPTSDALKAKYETERSKMFDKVGLKDPHTIPRNLHLLAGKEKIEYLEDDVLYVGRNNRFKRDNLKTYKTCTHEPHTVFEFCHNHVDFCNFVAHTKQTNIDVLTSELKVDRWYFDRYTNWTQEIRDTYAKIRQN